MVSVKRMGNHIANSPFKITVGEKEVGDATKVKVRTQAAGDSLQGCVWGPVHSAGLAGCTS